MTAIGDTGVEKSGERARRVRGIPWFEIGLLYGILVLLIAVDLVFAALAGFSLRWNIPLQDALFALLFAGIGVAYAVTGRSPALATMLFVVAALVFGAPAIMILDFMTKAMGAPLADPALDAWDDRLGLDWVGYEHWFSAHVWLSDLGGILYACAPLVLLAALVALAAAQRLRDLVWFAIATSGTLIVCVAISAFLPAAGPHQFYGVPDGGKAFWVQTLMQVVAERPRFIDLTTQPPMTTFPSFHTTLAILATLACWRIRWFGPIFAAFNLFWALSIPVWGSHYFIDIIVGAVIAIAGFGLVGAIARRRGTRTMPIQNAPRGRSRGLVGVAQEAGE
jgi:hypothetical protein